MKTVLLIVLVTKGLLLLRIVSRYMKNLVKNFFTIIESINVSSAPERATWQISSVVKNINHRSMVQ